MKGIILAGGKGTRLSPLTISVSKQLLPVYDKPIIYYPLSILMLAGIKDILIISTPEALPLYKKLLGDGSQLGMFFQYKVQYEPKGIADALIIGEKFIANDQTALILGDNIFCGADLKTFLIPVQQLTTGAVIFGYPTDNPSSFGIVEINEQGRINSLEEKPSSPKSNLAVPGLYFYDHKASEIAKNISPSTRGELEITAVNQVYLENDQLQVSVLPKEILWYDVGTHDSLLDASNKIHDLQKRLNQYVGNIEEIAFFNDWIDFQQLLVLMKPLEHSNYGKHLFEQYGMNQKRSSANESNNKS